MKLKQNLHPFAHLFFLFWFFCKIYRDIVQEIANFNKKSLTAAFGESPCIGITIFVPQWLQLLLPLTLAHLGGVGQLEELRCQLRQPLGFDGCHFSHVLLGRQHQLMVDHKIGIPMKNISPSPLYGSML